MLPKYRILSRLSFKYKLSARRRSICERRFCKHWWVNNSLFCKEDWVIRVYKGWYSYVKIDWTKYFCIIMFPNYCIQWKLTCRLKLSAISSLHTAASRLVIFVVIIFHFHLLSLLVMIVSNLTQSHILINGNGCWFSTNLEATLGTQGHAWLLKFYYRNAIYRVSHRYVNNFGLNFENWKITYVKK